MISKYEPKEDKYVVSESLSNSWHFLKIFNKVPGIYKFCRASGEVELDSYIGSSINLYQRCFIQHKNNAIKLTSKHKLFIRLRGN